MGDEKERNKVVNVDDSYLELLKNILDNGTMKENRTGVRTLAISGYKLEHDMAEGFPLLTTKKMRLPNVSSELEFFIKGLTDKKWLQDRGNHIWDEWCTPAKVSYGHDKETQERMKAERDLGPIYGFQWRHFDAEYSGHDFDYQGKGEDQLGRVTSKLAEDPNDRRMIVSAWNPKQIHLMALPPCHYAFQVTVTGDELNLAWNQRSCDVPLGVPYNVASYGLLLHLLARHSGFKEGKLTGFLMDTHIYENQLEGVSEQLTRSPRESPKIFTEGEESIYHWRHEKTNIDGYDPHPFIKFPIAV